MCLRADAPPLPTTMDPDLGDVEWRDLPDLCAEPSAFDALHVHLNGELVDPALPLPALPALDSAIPLTLALPDIKEDRKVEDVLDQPKQEPALVQLNPQTAPAPTTAAVQTPVSPDPAPQPAAPVVPSPASPTAGTPPRPTTSPPATRAPPRRARADSPATNSPASADTPSPVSVGRVEKGKVGSLREKRAREAAQFPRALLRNLSGTTSAEVRKMSSEERALVLFKRKLRNRESARRSRQKRQATLSDLHEELAELATVAARMVDLGAKLHATNNSLRTSLDLAHAQIRALRAAYEPPAAAAPALATPALPKDPTASLDRTKMKMGA